MARLRGRGAALALSGALALAGCATAPDAGKLSEARALQKKGDLPGAAGAYEGAYAQGCSLERPSVPCREALLSAGDATLESGRPRGAIEKYQLALKQLPHEDDAEHTIKSRIAAAQDAIERQKQAAQTQERCPVSILVKESVGKKLARSHAALSLDGQPIDLAKAAADAPVYSGPLLAMEHELAVDFAYAGKSSLEGYKYAVASSYSFVCPKGQPLQIVVNLVASNLSARGVEVHYQVQKAH